MLKILFCTTAYDHVITGAGGVARIIGSWSAHNPDHQVCILTEDCERSTGRFIKCTLDRWSKLPVLGFYFKAGKYATSLLRLLSDTEFDIILFHDVWLASGTRRYLARRSRRPAAVAFMHDDNTMDMPRGLKLNGRAISHCMRWLLERLVIGKLDMVITNSEYMKSRIASKYSIDSVARLYYTAHDYSTVEFLWKEREPGAPVRVLFAKHDFIRGGLRELLTALESIREYRFELTIVGPARENVRRKLGTQMENSSHIHVHVRGRVTSSTEMLRLYHEHDLLCVPSRREALGMAIAEAVASGTPVVTTTAGGICEVMNGTANGFLSPPGDIEALAASIRACLSDPREALKRTKAGRDFVVDRFNVNSMLQNLESILLETQTGIRQESHHSDAYPRPNPLSISDIENPASSRRG